VAEVTHCPSDLVRYVPLHRVNVFEQRKDEHLCAAIQSHKISAVECTTNQLLAEQPGTSFSHAMIVVIEEDNFAALEVLLGFSPPDKDVARAVAASKNTQLVQSILDHGWNIDKALCGS